VVEREAHLKRLMLLGLDGDAKAWRALLSDIRPALAAFFK
jgi:RNA polymerase sigma-70 factor (ECF subfamily)